MPYTPRPNGGAFDPASPGPIGGETPDAGTFTIVGVGTDTPGYTLDVQNPADSGGPLVANFESAGGDAQVYVQNGVVRTMVTADATTSAGVIGTFSNHDCVIRANNTEIARFLTDGSVGIGTTTPGTPLEVVGTVTATDYIGNVPGTIPYDTGWSGIAFNGDKTVTVSSYTAVDFSALDVTTIGLNALSQQVENLTKRFCALELALADRLLPNSD